MSKLIYSLNLMIDLLINENEIKYKAYLSGQIKKKNDNGIKIKSFWKDIVKDADICFILTIVDDPGKHVKNKRNYI